IFSPLSVGAHGLIRDGAGLVQNARDVLAALGAQLEVLDDPLKPPPGVGFEPARARDGLLIHLSEAMAVSAAELARKVGLPVAEEKGFKPHYEVVDDRQKTITELRAAIKKDPGQVILASDPDREGEAIAWHLAEVLHLRSPKRIEFHEITSDAVRRALETPREIDMRLVNAQQARRVVDRLVGFGLSPFLWSKVQKGIGAGRVSSVA